MIYLDHAATSYPKPPSVLAAMREWFEEFGVSAGRGDSGRCATVHARVEDARRRIGELCAMPSTRVAFTSGATDALNLFLHGFLRPGDAFLSTRLEHSSVVRPLRYLTDRLGLRGTWLPVESDGRVAPESFREALAADDYRLVVFSHASNVLGSALDAPAICAAAREHGVITLLDASPTAGLLELDVGADAIVASGHKSLLGPPGSGFLAVREGVELEAIRRGGTGSSTALDTHPVEWPTAMEAGTPNTPAILGLGAGLAFVEAEGREAILARELALLDAVRPLLRERGVEVYGPDVGPRIPVLSCNVPGYDCAEIGLLLDAQDIHVRTGFHCAPYLFEDLPDRPAGAVRISVGPFTSESDIRAWTTALPAART